jgi:hypothetical protein
MAHQSLESTGHVAQVPSVRADLGALPVHPQDEAHVFVLGLHGTPARDLLPEFLVNG